MHIFFTPDINPEEHYTLNAEESRHCIRVLRLREKDTIHLIDGKGGFYEAQILEPNEKKCTVEIITVQKEYGKRNFYLHIAIAPTKNIERLEWFLEKAAEIGIDEITPLLCEHSERTIIKTERLNKILVSAIKQSIKAYMPILNEPKKFSELVKQEFTGQKFIAHCEKGVKSHLENLYQKHNQVLILIGPEGDFSSSEIKLSKENNFSEISLGPSRLRTETAGVIACHTINLKNEV